MMDRVMASLAFGAMVLMGALGATGGGARVAAADRAVPRYEHIVLVVLENHGYESILGAGHAPNLARLAREYGVATEFYATTHPSEPNYVALFSGSTHGIRDDGPFLVNSVDAPNLATQLQARGLTWGGYFGGYDPARPFARFTHDHYAAKHNPFVNFVNLRNEPGFAAHQHPLSSLAAALRSTTLPNFALVIPNLCADMHGARGCEREPQKTIAGDAAVGALVAEIQRAPLWRAAQNAAIVITWDEDDGAHRSGIQGCCGTLPGGGRIATLVITNHGPRHLRDPHPYNHYSLLRTLEDAFGIHHYLGHAADWNAGIRPMLPLFAT